MPLRSYFKGDGEQVMLDMIRRYGRKKGQAIFYGTARRNGLAPKLKKKHHKTSRH